MKPESGIKCILIVANSGRMLAQLAKNAGYSSVVVDCFSDVDTQEIALECIKVDALSLEFLKPAVSRLIKKYRLTHSIYGSGLECDLDSLAYLQQNSRVLGNDLDTFTEIQNKAAFFSKLTNLAIPHPKVSFQFSDFGLDGLIKPMHGEGGGGIKKSKGLAEMQSSCYWQQYIVGEPMSVLFIANGTKAKIYGFHKQWVTVVGDNEFMFSGLINQPEIDHKLSNQVNSWVTALVNEFSLKGINSLDFMKSNEDCFVLEVNARPSASMQLYQTDLFSEHINSILMAQIEQNSDHYAYQCYQGYKIVFSENEIIIHDNIEWPSWVADIPVTGSTIHTGLPICSIIARGKSEAHVIDQIQSKQRLIKKLLQ